MAPGLLQHVESRSATSQTETGRTASPCTRADRDAQPASSGPAFPVRWLRCGATGQGRRRNTGRPAPNIAQYTHSVNPATCPRRELIRGASLRIPRHATSQGRRATWCSEGGLGWTGRVRTTRAQGWMPKKLADGASSKDARYCTQELRRTAKRALPPLPTSPTRARWSRWIQLGVQPRAHLDEWNSVQRKPRRGDGNGDPVPVPRRCRHVRKQSAVSRADDITWTARVIS